MRVGLRSGTWRPGDKGEFRVGHFILVYLLLVLPFIFKSSQSGQYNDIHKIYDRQNDATSEALGAITGKEGDGESLGTQGVSV